MNTIDILTKVAEENKISTGRVEMILSIIVEKITDKLRKDGEVTIKDFGTFKLFNKKNVTLGFSEHDDTQRNYVLFTPDKIFNDIINS